MPCLQVPFPPGASQGQLHTFRLTNAIQQRVSIQLPHQQTPQQPEPQAQPPIPTMHPHSHQLTTSPKQQKVRGYSKMKLSELQSEIQSRGVTTLPKGKAQLLSCLKRLDSIKMTSCAASVQHEVAQFNQGMFGTLPAGTDTGCNCTMESSAAEIVGSKPLRIVKKKRPLEAPGLLQKLDQKYTNGLTRSIEFRLRWRSAICFFETW